MAATSSYGFFKVLIFIICQPFSKKPLSPGEKAASFYGHASLYHKIGKKARLFMAKNETIYAI